MSTNFKTLVGKRVLVNKPEKPESKIQLTPESESLMEQEMMKQWTALEVYAIVNEVDLCYDRRTRHCNCLVKWVLSQKCLPQQ